MGLRVPYWVTPTEALDAQGLAELQATLALRMLGAKESDVEAAWPRIAKGRR